MISEGDVTGRKSRLSTLGTVAPELQMRGGEVGPLWVLEMSLCLFQTDVWQHSQEGVLLRH